MHSNKLLSGKKLSVLILCKRSSKRSGNWIFVLTEHLESKIFELTLACIFVYVIYKTKDYIGFKILPHMYLQIAVHPA